MFKPERIIFEKGALDWERARMMKDYFKNDSKIEIIEMSNNKVK